MAEGSDSFDLVILGGGNAGYACAFRAVKLGMSVAMIEKEKVGGTCLHRGCIPTKALLHSAELLDEIRHAGQFGIQADDNPGYDWDQVKRFKDSVVGSMYKGLAGLVKRKKIEQIDGWGRLVDNKTVVVKTDGGGALGHGQEGSRPGHRFRGARSSLHRGRRQARAQLESRP